MLVPTAACAASTYALMQQCAAYAENGEYDKARETLEALIKWGATPEYYLLERYADNDPYWVPWMPNASGNGRLLNMLADSDRLYK